MSNRSLAALVAGFGTGYLQGQKQKEEKERQDKIDKANEEDRRLRNDDIRQRQQEHLEQKQREDAAMAGLSDAAQMKVGELRNQDGVVDNSQQAWQDRIANTPDNQGNLPTPEIAAQTAPIYAQAAAQKGAENWLSSDAPDAVVGKVKPTSRGDIARTQAAAIAKLGVTGLPQSMALNDKADELDLKDLKMRIAKGTPESLSKEYDDIFPDGLTLKFETGTDGKLYKFTEDAQGNRSNWQTYNDLDHFKQEMMAMVDKDPEGITKYWKESREIDRENKKDVREEKVTNAQLAKYQQDIDKGAIELKSLPEKLQLELKEKKANINQSNASAESSRASTAKTREEAKGGGDKLPASVKEALWYQQATPEQKKAFDDMNDKSPKVTNDASSGGFLINKKDGLYRMDVKGNVTKVVMPDGKIVPANRPPLSSFDNK